MRKILRGGLLAIVIAWAAASALAQEDAVVITATRVPQYYAQLEALRRARVTAKDSNSEFADAYEVLNLVAYRSTPAQPLEEQAMILKILSTAAVAALLALPTASFAQTSSSSASPSGTSIGAGASGSVEMGRGRCEALTAAEQQKCLAERDGAPGGAGGTGSKQPTVVATAGGPLPRPACFR